MGNLDLTERGGKKYDFENYPTEFSEILHVFSYEQANQQSLLAFFPIFS